MGQPLETFHFTPEQRQIAMQLLEAANDVHESENSRRYRYTQVLRKALRKDVFPNEEYEDSTTLSYKIPASGGHRVITCPFLPDGSCAATCWTDLTAEIGSLDSDPNTRSECNYALAVTSDKYRHIREASCCPALLFGFAGPYLIVNGAIFTDRLVSERLTPDYFYLGARPHPSGGSDLEHGVDKIAQLLQVVKESLDELEQFYLDLKPAPQQGLAHAPHFRQYKYKEDTFQLTYLERLSHDLIDRATFKAEAQNCTTKETSLVVVKFTHAYNRKAHELLSEHSLAPALRYYGRPDDVDMVVVVMDFVDGGPVDGRLTDSTQIRLLRQAVTLVHDEGLVFGDLRGPNMLVDFSQGLQLIDLDWCGPEGSARYPSDINLSPDLKWHPEVMGAGIIKKEHDLYMFERLTREKF